MKEKRENIVDELCEYFKGYDLYDTERLNKILALSKILSLMPRSEVMDAQKQIIETIEYDFDKNGFSVLCAQAEKDTYSFYALSKIASQWINTSQDIPQEIKSWVCRYLTDEIHKPRSRSGKKKDYAKRLMLSIAVHKVVQKGFPAGKNSSSDTKDNAYDIVQEAAHKAGFNDITYHSVKEAHQNSLYLKNK